MDDLSMLNARAALLRVKLAAEAMPNTPPAGGGPALTPGGLGPADGYLMSLENRPPFEELSDVHSDTGRRPLRETGAAALGSKGGHGGRPAGSGVQL